MVDVYRKVGIFAHENPVRRARRPDRALDPQWIHAMHGGTLSRETLVPYVRALARAGLRLRGKADGPRDRARWPPPLRERPTVIRAMCASDMAGGQTPVMSEEADEFSVSGEVAAELC